MWWWNDYYWHMPWMFGPLVMLFLMALCIGMLFVNDAWTARWT